MKCNYEGSNFGAHYWDAQCIDGYLYDLDKYEDGMLTGGPEIPCPKCNTWGYTRYHNLYGIKRIIMFLKLKWRTVILNRNTTGDKLFNGTGKE